jgi:protocatechuate 3,4-dioxygenase beta subunit
VLLLIGAGNGAERKKDEMNRGVIRSVGQPSQSDTRKALSVQKPTLSEQKQAGRKFDMRRLEREVKTLKKISQERVIIERMQQSQKNAEQEHAAREAMGAQHLDKVKIFGKPTRFNQAPGVPKPTFSNRAARSLVSNVNINGKLRDTIYVGDPFALSFSLSPGNISAVLNVYFDADSDGVVSAGDILLEGNILMLDDDENDADPAVGAYRIEINKGDLFNSLVTSLLFEVNDYQSVSSAMLTVRQKPTSSFVLVTVDPPKPFLGCYISGSPLDYYVFTDSAGKSSFYVDRQQTTQLQLRPFDFTGVANGYVRPQPKTVSITSDTTRVNFTFAPATAFIEGYVKDQSGDAVRNLVIEVYGSSFYVYAKTDTSGYYKAGVAEGQWYLYPIYPQTAEYMRGNSSSINVTVPGNVTVRKDIFVLKANNTISGKVTFNANGVGGVRLYADTDTLYNSVLSSTNGDYSIPVYKPSAGTKLYYVNVSLNAGAYFVVDPYRPGIQPGATNVNFEIKKVAGGLKGRITDINTGKPIPNAYISASGITTGRSTTSNDSGFYHMSLQDGTYSVYVSASTYYYYSEDNIVIAGSMVTKDIALHRSGSFSGTVKDEGDKPVLNAYIDAVDSSGYGVGSGYPDNTGNYVVGGLRTSKYRAYASANGYVPQWYNKVSVMDSAAFFQVTDGFDTPNINFVLSRGGTISGKVVDKSGKPIPGVEIEVFDTSYNYRAYTMTNDSGLYTAGGLLTGKYYVGSFSSFYLDQWYDGASSPFTATKVAVVINQNTPNINFTLSSGASISGMVKTKSNIGIGTAYVVVLDSALSSVAYGYPNDSGYYHISKLGSGKKYYVVAYASGYAFRWYNNVSSPDSATPIVLLQEEKRENINFILPLASMITGRVFDDAGKPIAYANVQVEDIAGIIYIGASTDQEGNYLASGLSGGKYYVRAYNYPYLEQWFDHKATRQQADKVMVAEETVTSDINFDLQRAAGISGTVVDDSTSLGISYLLVTATRKSDGSLYTASTNLDGSYYFPLPAGNFIVRAIDDYYYVSQYYAPPGGTALRANAKEVTVVDGQSPKLADFRLQKRKDSYAFTNEKLGMTMTNFGSFAFRDDSTSPRGRWPLPSSPNYLFDGNIWLGAKFYDDTFVSGGPYEYKYGEWSPLWNYTVKSNSDSQRVETFFTGTDSLGSLVTQGNLVVRQTSYSWRNTDYAIYQYTILYQPNLAYTLPSIQNVYVGFFLDFDIGQGGTTDKVGIDKSNSLIYMYNSAAPNGVNMGVRLLSGPMARLTWWNLMNDPLDDVHRYGRMMKDTSTAIPTVADDYRIFVSAGPFAAVNPGDSISVSIAVVAGNGATGIIAASKEAYAKYVLVGVQEDAVVTAPKDFALDQNYPNPFNPSTTIAFDIPSASFVSLRVYNILGQEVAALVDEVRPAGRYHERWNANSVASGIYFYNIRAGSFTQTRKMLLVK